VDRLIAEHLDALGEMLRGDAQVREDAPPGRLRTPDLNPSATETGEPTYLLDATIALGTCIPRAARMTVKCPRRDLDGHAASDPLRFSRQARRLIACPAQPGRDVCRRSRGAVSDRYASFERKSAGFTIRTFRHLRSRRR
jgi:hypothetical protein